MAERKSDRWISLTQSVLLHAAVIGALAYGFYAYKKQTPPPPPPTLAIEGTVVSDKDLAPVKPKAEPLPVPPPEPEPPPQEPPEDVGPPSPSPEEVQQREQEEQRKQEEQQRADEERVALEKKQAEEREVAERKEREDAERKREQAKREAEQKRLADEKRKAEEKRKADEEKVRVAREAELRKSLEAEERQNALKTGPAMQTWLNQITAHIDRHWNRPPSAKTGLVCIVHVKQVPGGTVTSAEVEECNGDAAVRESLRTAAFNASPLPPPPDPAMFDPDIKVRFSLN